MINVKCKKEKEEGLLLGMKLCYLDLFSQKKKIERLIDINNQFHNEVIGNEIKSMELTTILTYSIQSSFDGHI